LNFKINKSILQSNKISAYLYVAVEGDEFKLNPKSFVMLYRVMLLLNRERNYE